MTPPFLRQMSTSIKVLFAGLFGLGLPGARAVVVDGSLSGDSYGEAVAVQTVGTQFGNNFSELNAAYAQFSGNSMFLMFTGNLENNFNKFTLFIDSQDGGQNVIDRDTNANNDNWAQFFDGFQFDEGFSPDYVIFLRHGNAMGEAVLDIDYAVIGEDTGDRVGRFSYRNPPSTGPFVAENGIVVGFDNSNAAGISDSSANEEDALAVETGIELEIPLELLGDVQGDVRVTALINGANHDFVSNQFLAGLPSGSGNLGTDGTGGFVANSSLTIDLNDFEGEQFFTVPFELPAVDPAFVSNVSATVNALEIFVRDTETSSLDVDSIRLTVDDVERETTPSSADGLTIVTYTPDTVFAPGSDHTYDFAAVDNNGVAIGRSGTFSLPNRLLPTGGLPGPEGVAGFWALRQIWDLEDLYPDGLQSLADAVSVAEAAERPGFEGSVSDDLVDTLNFGEGGIFYQSSVYPAQIDPLLQMSEDEYVVVAKAFVEIPRGGDWTFGVHSDDGFALRLVGAEFASVHGGGQLDPLDLSVMGFDGGTEDSNTRGIVRNLAAGVYEVQVITWDGSGNDFLEVYAAPGAFESDSETSDWRLIGQTPLTDTFLVPGVSEAGWTVRTSVPGETVLNTIEDALAVIESVTDVTEHDGINFNDPDSDGPHSGTISDDVPFPNDTENGDDHFALLAEATLVIPESGTYWLGFQGDDGGFLELPGQQFDRIVQNATGSATIEEGERIACDCLTGNSRTVAEITLDAGEYPIRVLWFESGFNAYFEVFGAEAGSQTFPLVVAGGAGRRDTQGGLAIVDSGAGGNIRIESIERDGATATVTWTSEPGGYYIVERSSSLTSGSWERLTEAYPEGGATGELLSFVDAEASLMNAYYRVASDSPPPYLSSGFETGDEGWVQVRKDGDSGETSWERGTPTAGPGAPFAGENVYGTNLAGDYGNGARLALRSPIIDLTEAIKPTLDFWFFLDADSPEGGLVNVLDANGNVLRSQLFLFTGDLSSPDWRRAVTRLPGEAIGQRIQLEFEFLSDDGEPNGAGWYLDEVTVGE